MRLLTSAPRPVGVEYELVWNGRDELVHRPRPPPVPTTRFCGGCWRRRLFSDFGGDICRRCARVRKRGRLRDRRKAARARGISQRGFKRRTVSRLTICATCRARRRRTNAERRRRLAAAGRCQCCGALLPRGWKRRICPGCSSDDVATVAKHRAARLASGLCRTCGKRPRAELSRRGLSTQCRPCLDRAARRKAGKEARLHGPLPAGAAEVDGSRRSLPLIRVLRTTVYGRDRRTALPPGPGTSGMDGAD